MSVAQTFLIVEPEFLIALDIQRVLESFDPRQCVLAANPGEVSALSREPVNFALAVIAFRSGDAAILAFARSLARSRVPIVLLVSEIGLRRGISELPGAPVVIKPFLEEDLARAVQTALASDHIE